MRNANRIWMAIICLLLCTVLVTTCVLSGIFARFSTKNVVSASLPYKAWGFTITPGGGGVTEVTTDDKTTVKVNSTIGGADDKLVAPGTRGAITYLHIEGTADVDYAITFDGTIDIGYGFWSVSNMIAEKDYVIRKLKTQNPTWDDTQAENEYYRLLGLKKSVQIYDEVGREIEYFPIQLYLRRYDLNAAYEKESSDTPDQRCVVRLSPDAPADATVYNDDNPSYIDHRWCFFGEGGMATIRNLEERMNGVNYWNDVFFAKRVFTANNRVNSVYALEWSWLYHYDTVAEADDMGENESNRDETARGDYQTAELDTQLGEAILKYPDLFNITLNMSVTVEQINNYPCYESYTDENGNEKIVFGSYPQSEVADTTLSAKLTNILKNADDDDPEWTTYNGKSYIDIMYDGDKYRGVNLTTSADGIVWYKFEPIVWSKVKVDGKRALLLCDSILDKRLWQDAVTTDANGNVFNASAGVPSGTYANNYKYSTIREWLNETFYETAFSEFQQTLFHTITVENNAASTGETVNKFASHGTYDRVFLLSVEELGDNDISVNTSQVATAYANKMSGKSHLWTRSPCPSEGGLPNKGQFVYVVMSTVPYPLKFDDYARGVVPAIWITCLDK